MFRSAELMHKWWQCKSVDFITSIFKTSSNYYLSLDMYRKLLIYTLRRVICKSAIFTNSALFIYLENSYANDMKIQIHLI